MKVNKIIKSMVEEELEIMGATLLSIEEAEEYLTKDERRYKNWWWLRSPGYSSDDAALVNDDGDISGNYYVDNNYSYVRPALIIKNLESSGMSIGDTFKLAGYEFKIISENLAWMHKQDIGQYAFNEDYKNGNDYETSDIKKVVDKWFESLVFNESEEKGKQNE